MNPASLTHAIKRAITRNSVANMKRGRVIMKFAEKLGFVYFGSVDQHHDDHHIIRGLTVSASHEDAHYSVGSFDGYDVSIVDRIDTVKNAAGNSRTHTWLIVEIDLHNNDIPHLFVGAHDHSDTAYAKLFTAFPALTKIPLGTFEEYPEEFTKRYSMFGMGSQFLTLEKYLNAETTRTVAAHFWPLSFEIFEGALYVYSDSNTLSSHLLDTMIKNALWLAEQLDNTHIDEE